MATTDPKESVAYLRSTKAIREQSARLSARVAAGDSPYFTLHLPQLAAAADLVVAEIRTNYPDLKIPYHS
ncbi:DUF1688 family protein, partial [Enterococcus faecium]